MASVGESEENGYAERLKRTIKEEEVDLSEYEDFTRNRGSTKRPRDHRSMIPRACREIVRILAQATFRFRWNGKIVWASKKSAIEPTTWRRASSVSSG